MAGRSSVEVFKKLEINTIGDLAHADVNVITLHLKSHGRMLWNFANGIGDDKVQYEPEEAKGSRKLQRLCQRMQRLMKKRERYFMSLHRVWGTG